MAKNRIGGEVAYWKFDEGAGSTSHDSSTTGVNLSLAGSPSWVSSPANGLQFENPYAISFNGSNQYGTAGNVLGFGRTTAFSVAFWINADMGGVFRWFCGKQDLPPTSRGWRISNGPTGFRDSVLVQITNDASSNGAQVRTTGAVLGSGWKHIGFSYTGISNATGITIYVNGDAAPTTTLQDTLSQPIASTADFSAGARAADLGGALNGQIDDLRIFGKVLSAEDFAILASGGPLDRPTKRRRATSHYYRQTCSS